MVSCFNLHVSDNMWYGTSFHMFICHLYIFFGKMSFKVFDHFFHSFIDDLIVEF